MKRDEAIYLLNNLRSVAEGKENEAIDMAIKVLQIAITEKVHCKDCDFALTTTSDDIYYCKLEYCHVFANWTCER